MQPGKSISLFIGLIILVSAVACGQQPTPITNPPAVETSLAGTARALAQQTETARGFTPTPSVVPSETLTPMPRISSSGTSLESLADGSTRFTDYTAEIQVVFPADWLLLRVGEPEYYQAWERETANHPMFQEVFTTMQTNDPDVFRVTAIDIRTQVTYDTFSKIDLVFSDADMRSLNEIRMGQTQNPPPLTGYQLISSSISKTPDGLEAAIIEFQWESASPENITSTNYHKQILIQTPSGFLAIQLFTGLDRKDSVLPAFDQVIDSLVFINS